MGETASKTTEAEGQEHLVRRYLQGFGPAPSTCRQTRRKLGFAERIFTWLCQPAAIIS
jgi:hypothetical protein